VASAGAPLVTYMYDVAVDVGTLSEDDPEPPVAAATWYTLDRVADAEPAVVVGAFTFQLLAIGVIEADAESDESTSHSPSSQSS
jgi:hypothetical protein